jgi:hypothetical protein
MLLDLLPAHPNQRKKSLRLTGLRCLLPWVERTAMLVRAAFSYRTWDLTLAP